MMKQATQEARNYKTRGVKCQWSLGQGEGEREKETEKWRGSRVSSRGGSGVSLKGDVERVQMLVVEGQTCDAGHLHFTCLELQGGRAVLGGPGYGGTVPTG